MKINEKLGIPEGINKQAEIIHKRIMSEIENITIPKDYKNDTIIIEIIKADIEFRDLKLENVPFNLSLTYYDRLDDKAKLISANFNIISEPATRKKIISHLAGINSSYFSVKVAVGDDIELKDIVECLKKELETRIIAHEIKHLYDLFKSPNQSALVTSKYDTYSKISGFPKKIIDLMFLLYYTSSIECSVRPVELYQDIIDNNITKKDFREYMKSNDMIKRLQEAKNFSLDNLIKDLNNDKDTKYFLEEVDRMGYKRIGDNATDILNILFINLSNGVISEAESIIDMYVNKYGFSSITNFFTGRVDKDVQELANKTFKKILRSYSKFRNNPIKFFENIEKELNFVGDKMIKKLYKLYDMTPSNKLESIVNWELYSKINSTPIHLTIDFDKFKRS